MEDLQLVIIGAVLSFLAAFVIMWLTNRHNKKMQERSRRIDLCDNVILLAADLCVVAKDLHYVTHQTVVHGFNPQGADTRQRDCLMKKSEFAAICLKMKTLSSGIGEFEWLPSCLNNIENLTAPKQPLDSLEIYLNEMIEDLQSSSKEYTGRAHRFKRKTKETA